MSPCHQLTATEARRQIAAGELTSEQLVRACLDHIAAREAAVGAWTHIAADAAIARARDLDRSPPQGLLHGIPVGVKDLIDTCDMPAAYGSAIYAGHRPPWDAPCVALARTAGAVVLGKTVTTELAYFTPGKTANPHNPSHTPGGSSSGSAAAVADGMVPLAFGSQTAGSVIRPAAFCGVVGYKPSFGLISRVGVKPLSDTLDTIGVLARSVRDAALFAAAASGRHDLLIEKPSPDASNVPRVGICRTFEWARAQPETHAAMDTAIKQLGAAGVTLVDVDLPPNFAGMVQAQLDIMTYEMARALAYEWHARRTQLSQKLQDLIAAGLALPRERYDAAMALTHNCRRALTDLFAKVDVLLAPSTIGEAPAGLGATGDPLFNRVWTILHTPCVHLPFAQGPNGLPVGLQVIGPVGDDRHTLLHADYLMERLA